MKTPHFIPIIYVIIITENKKLSIELMYVAEFMIKIRKSIFIQMLKLVKMRVNIL
ncbi:hypothetical protein acsn021_12430 [Anaerocolumna cellulosilytica]|uniref:Uncharacterized protein n=1 Tax=Anaerocolumna cellulosilytica TaxID=433286 RepID=A0A6S6QSU7_9FIRM|nr:hypothetical protein acsn021_12430 [Anaerocolumna cellulosilytica]